MPMLDTTVLVAGGGIGGLACGTALALAGFRTVVVEKTTGRDRAGAGLVLYPNGVKALGAISSRLRDAVIAAGHVARPGDIRPVLNPAGEVVAVDRVGDLTGRFGAPQVSLLRAELHGALLNEAADAGVTVLPGVSVTDHADHGHYVETILSDRTRMTAAVLVGADGLYSAIRQRLVGDGPPQYRGYTTVRGVSGQVGAYPHGFIATGDGTAVFASPIAGGALYWTAKLTAEPGIWPALGHRQALAGLLDLLAGWHPPIVNMIRDYDTSRSPVVTDINDREPTGQWSAGRVTLLGDSAHPMSPGAGQGASMALEDAVALAGALRTSDDVRVALRSYAGQRAPRTAKVVYQSRQRDTLLAPGEREFSTEDEQFADLFGWQPEALAIPVQP
jgi:2-polyprenyl-6-methoxyphenol hydroxylase-like FAD-dependent oxidoreductase